jgi:hypothetical protein
MSLYRFTTPSRILRGAKLDNLALVPANLLPFKSQWQAIANGLTRDGVLILLPSGQRPPRKILETVASLLKAGGHQVTTLPAQRFSGL